MPLELRHLGAPATPSGSSSSMHWRRWQSHSRQMEQLIPVGRTRPAPSGNPAAMEPPHFAAGPYAVCHNLAANGL